MVSVMAGGGACLPPRPASCAANRKVRGRTTVSPTTIGIGLSYQAAAHPCPPGRRTSAHSAIGLLFQLPGNLLHFAPDTEQIAAPQLADLLFGVAAADQLQGDVEGFGRAIP